jgi:hypothetical protein
VAVFPHFHTPRTRKAICVIFAEDENILEKNLRLTRFKRSLTRHPWRRSHRRSTYLSSQVEKYSYPRRNKLSEIYDAVRCIKTRLIVLLRDVKSKEKRKGKKPRKDGYDHEINSMDDCFNDMDEPRYGFVCRVRLVEDQPCVLGVTCRGVPDDEDDLLVDLFDPAFELQNLDEDQVSILPILSYFNFTKML